MWIIEQQQGYKNRDVWCLTVLKNVSFLIWKSSIDYYWWNMRTSARLHFSFIEANMPALHPSSVFMLQSILTRDFYKHIKYKLQFCMDQCRLEGRIFFMRDRRDMRGIIESRVISRESALQANKLVRQLLAVLFKANPIINPINWLSCSSLNLH